MLKIEEFSFGPQLERDTEEMEGDQRAIAPPVIILWYCMDLSFYSV
jgi:hypothetical protein